MLSNRSLNSINQIRRAFGLENEISGGIKEATERTQPISDLKSLKTPLTLECFPLTSTNLLQQPFDFRHAHLAYCARNPDKGSDFDLRHSQAIAQLTDDKDLFRYHISNRFGGMIFSENGKVCSHILFQEHAQVLHIFSIFTASDRRNLGIGSRAVLTCLEHAKKMPKIKGLRIGRGTEPFVKSFLKKLAANSQGYGIAEMYTPAWIKF